MVHGSIPDRYINAGCLLILRQAEPPCKTYPLGEKMAVKIYARD